MSTSLTHILNTSSPVRDADGLLSQAIREAGQMPDMRRGAEGEESNRDRMRRLKDTLQKELVAFHDFLPVKPYTGDIKGTRANATLYEVGIPLTLFPKRSKGFSCVDVIVEFDSTSSGNSGPRVLQVYPANRSELIAKLGINGKVEMKANAKAGIPVQNASATPIADVAANVYAGLDIPGLQYQAKRICVETEIIEGHGARWRLEDPQNREQLSVETHQLSVILEVTDQELPVNAAGYMNAYSDTRWLTASLGSLWQDFSGTIRDFFKRGLPKEAYGEWENIITTSSS